MLNSKGSPWGSARWPKHPWVLKEDTWNPDDIDSEDTDTMDCGLGDLYTFATETYLKNHAFTPYPWQKLIACSFLRMYIETSNHFDMTYLLSLPPSHGKTAVISIVANMILALNDQYTFVDENGQPTKIYPDKIFIITTTSYLAQMALCKYGNTENSAY